jgi:hypothetical protein
MLYFAQFVAILQVRSRVHQLPPINFDSFFLDGFFLGSVFRARHCVLHGFALVRVELLLNSRLSELTRVGRELRIARFTNPQGRDVADSFQDAKAALCHAPSFPYRRKPRHRPGSWRDGRPRPSKPSPCGDGRPRPSSPDKPNIFAVHASLHRFRARASLPSCYGNSH